MRRAIVVAGPMGSGKTTFCRSTIAANPGITLISRDDILNELFGTVWLNPYTGQHQYGEKVMWERVATALQAEHAFIILDTWNGSREERSKITKNLRSFGADWIAGWRFITPEAIGLQWYIERESVGKDEKQIRALKSPWRAEDYHHDYLLFHAHGVSEDQGFNVVHDINPQQCSFLRYLK